MRKSCLALLLLLCLANDDLEILPVSQTHRSDSPGLQQPKLSVALVLRCLSGKMFPSRVILGKENVEAITTKVLESSRAP